MRCFSFLVALGAGLLAGLSALDCVAADGYAVPIGGALAYDNAMVWSRLVALAGGKGARFVVLPTASGEPRESGERIAATLRKHGARVEVLPIAPAWPGIDSAAAVRDPKWVAKVRAARGVFFAGGAQERIVDTLQPQGVKTPVLEAVWEVYRRGGVVAGTSAGAAVMSETMFRDAQDTLAVMQGRLREGQEIDRGLGFVGPALFVDQHFLRRGRLGRLLPLMQGKNYRYGLGVDENTAAIVQGERIEVLGASGAIVVDLDGATQDERLGTFNLRGARLTYLENGDRLVLSTFAVTPAHEKAAGRLIDPQSGEFRPYYRDSAFYPDILGDRVVVQAMTHLIDGVDSEVRGLAFRPGITGAPAAPGFHFRFYRKQDSSGWFTATSGGESYTVSKVYLDVTPVRMATPLYSPWSP